MSGYCPDCGNTLCICDDITKATYPYRQRILRLKTELAGAREVIEFYANPLDNKYSTYGLVIDHYEDKELVGKITLKSGLRARKFLKTLEEK